MATKARGGFPASALTILGRFELRSQGATVIVPLAVQRLVAFLALRGGATCRTEVVRHLWPRNDAHAQASLRSTLWRLRRSCRAELVVVDGNELALAWHLSVDATDEVRRAREILANNELVISPSSPLLQGQLLAGWCDDWVAVERERVHQLRMHALEVSAARLVSRREVGAAVDLALLAISADPLRESAQRALIVAHLAGGNICEAMRSYERYEELLRRRMGVSPAIELSTLLKRETDMRPVRSA